MPLMIPRKKLRTTIRGPFISELGLDKLVGTHK